MEPFLFDWMLLADDLRALAKSADAFRVAKQQAHISMSTIQQKVKKKRPTLCFYHRKFEHKATKCITSCEYQENADRVNTASASDENYPFSCLIKGLDSSIHGQRSPKISSIPISYYEIFNSKVTPHLWLPMSPVPK